MTESANRGYPKALRRLGEMYLNGDFVEVDVNRARDLLSKAAASGG